MKTYGLIGFPLSHSWSAGYFTEKFRSLDLRDHVYKLFELREIAAIRELIAAEPGLRGLNVTIPHKVAVIPFLDELDADAKSIGAVNCISISRQQDNAILKGYNTDVYGFETSLAEHLQPHHRKALVLGNGGAARAVCHVLQKLGIEYRIVSRHTLSAEVTGYKDLGDDMIHSHLLIINTTPLGMFPDISSCPDIPFDQLGKDHLLFDLVYNPAETVFLRRGKAAGAACVNGLRMLELQAEKSWELWNSKK